MNVPALVHKLPAALLRRMRLIAPSSLPNIIRMAIIVIRLVSEGILILSNVAYLKNRSRLP